MASKIKVDQIEGSTGSTITVPTGQTLTLTDGLGVSSLPTVTVAKGGTNLTSFTAGDVLYATGSTTLAKLPKGTAEQVLAMNAGATAPDWGSVDLTVLPTITVAKGGTGQAGGFTAGDILYATGATTLAKLAKGTAAQALVMNAGATAPEWATAASGGAWNFISNTTISDDDAVLVTGLDSTYDVYKLYAVSINNSTSDGTWLYQWQSSNSIQTSSYEYASRGVNSLSNGEATYSSKSASGMKANCNGNQTDTNRPQNHEVTIYHPSNTSHYKHIQVTGVYMNNDQHLYTYFNGGVWENTSAVTGINLIRDGGGTFTTGNLYLYGLSKS